MKSNPSKCCQKPSQDHDQAIGHILTRWDEHPHVHVVLKAVNEQGGSAAYSQAITRVEAGVRAAFTEAWCCGECDGAVGAGAEQTWKRDGIYRAAQRGGSAHMRETVEEAARELAAGRLGVEEGRPRLLATRKEVEQGMARGE